ncbi:protein of unknown function [Taphrina deformans PYCC 5710]|uniref:Uncharacterized protein n=1 Tax=Taphrina deformans (strain PYCC 5710 / ATCC 11124 / CBS 356.35 / IMI 108563 / JCM 9778 / NBRC 8474) TaxID=1097556 RepID=R4XAP1_TAPDE|nr:protein of unknown function [Taphrina deformans PYCC 5710]|eukprot:CCG81378.1 protein of unknown function [Taphrina deformans PYCC 5710]
MHIQDRLRIAGAGIAAQLLKYYDEGPPGLFGHPPVSESGWLWWQTPIALQALLSHEEISFDTSHHSHIQEAFLLNLGNDHRIFSPAWGGIENDEKNDDMLWWTLAALQANDSVILEGALRSYDHVRRFWANEAGSSCLGGIGVLTRVIQDGHI